MSIKVIDLNEEVKEEAPALEPIEEEEAKEPETAIDTVNEIIEKNKEEHEFSCSIREPSVETPVEQPKPKPKAKPKASDIVSCDKCHKSMTYKNLRYSHKCSPEPPPVKKQAKPKPKAKQQPKPKPPPEVYYSDSEEEEHKPLSKPVAQGASAGQQGCLPVRNQVLKPQPITPASALAQHYQLLQQEFIKQKQEKYNNLCMNMFSSKTKKR